MASTLVQERMAIEARCCSSHVWQASTVCCSNSGKVFRTQQPSSSKAPDQSPFCLFSAFFLLTSTVGFPRESMMNLPLTPVIADMLRLSTGRAARAAALVMEESILGEMRVLLWLRLWPECLLCVLALCFSSRRNCTTAAAASFCAALGAVSFSHVKTRGSGMRIYETVKPQILISSSKIAHKCTYNT